MAYTDPDTVRLALSPGGDEADVGTAASLDDTDLDAAISEAADEVNAKLSGRYTVPFDPVPDLVATVTTTIAGYLATLTARGGDPILPGDPVLLRYQRAEQILTQLQNGQATLNSVTTPTAAVGSGPVVTNVLTGSLFDLTDFFDQPGACDPSTGAYCAR